MSADEDLIERARQRARSELSTLNEVFRDFLRDYAAEPDKRSVKEFLESVRKRVNPSRKFTREEMNERR